MNDRDTTDRTLAREFFLHHARETDARSCRHLTAMMARLERHRESCRSASCPVTLHAFLSADAEIHRLITDQFVIQHDAMPGHPLEIDKVRQKVRNESKQFVRIFHDGGAIYGVLPNELADPVFAGLPKD